MDAIRKLVDALKEDFEDIGMYLQDATIASDQPVEGQEEGVTPDVRELMTEGGARFAIIADFGLNELAFSDRVLDPEGHEEKKEFNQIMPSAADVTAESLKQQLKDKINKKKGN